jgi:Tfp pilus assembly protein PilF
MKWFSVIMVLLLALSGARAEGPDDQYVAIYNLIQDADSQNSSRQFSRALTRYREAQSALAKFQKDYPDWNPKVVGYRLNYLAGSIEAVLPKVPAAAAPSPRPATPGPARAPGAGPAPAVNPALPPDWDAQVGALKDQLRRVQEEKVSLEAKLKEALAAQPAAMDPRELAKADEKIKALLKEIDLLKVSLQQTKAQPASAADPKALEAARQALDKANRDLAGQTGKASALEKERTALQNKLNRLNDLPSSSPNAGAVTAARKDVEAANRKADEQAKLASQLAQEKEALLSRSKADSQTAGALRTENQLLKKQLAELKLAPPPSSRSQAALWQLSHARAQIAVLESDKEILRLEKLDLENQLQRLSGRLMAAKAPPAAAKAENPKLIKKLEQERDDLKRQLETANKELKSARTPIPAPSPKPVKAEDPKLVKKLERERDDLRKQLEAANKELSARKSKVATARSLEAEQQLAALRARLGVLEAQPLPYTAEELALFRTPEAKPVPADSKPAVQASKELPPDSVALVAEAKRYFSAKQLDKAEDRYLQVLRQEQNHVPTLANLAAVELELNHLSLAETNILQALVLAPDDPSCLLVLGHLRFRQGQYDAALDALSRAAKADQRNAEVQNYLGLTLSAKGLRVPAETALRKAVQLEPGYGQAHNNLAVIYATQKPPLLELARWHYQKALTAGNPANPELEKLLEARKAADGAK